MHITIITKQNTHTQIYTYIYIYIYIYAYMYTYIQHRLFNDPPPILTSVRNMLVFSIYQIWNTMLPRVGHGGSLLGAWSGLASALAPHCWSRPAEDARGPEQPKSGAMHRATQKWRHACRRPPRQSCTGGLDCLNGVHPRWGCGRRVGHHVCGHW